MHRSTSLAILAALTVAGCSRRDHDRDLRKGSPGTIVRSSADADTSGSEDEVRIVNADSAVDLALRGDTISAGLSRRVLARVRSETDTTTTRSTGFGGSFEKLVKSSVRSAIGTRVAFPVSAVKDVRYENGRLVFEWTDKPVKIFEHTKSGEKPVLETFREEDARRFAEAVMARKSATLQQ